MIYRIHPITQKYLCLHIEGKEARKALGEDTDFNIDPSPISYSEGWQSMNVTFFDDGSGADTIPDISMRVGKLFLSLRAYEGLKDALISYGEFLPVTYDDKNGYIFNCLTLAEQHGAINKERSMHDPLNDRFSIVFDEEKLSDINMFRCEIDLDGFFVSSKIKEIVERKQLTGIIFSEDIGHPFPPNADMKREH
ncbi:hypothetical protein [Marinibactrum halimedae]|uniref:Uncharacterized protein n=1 Tax=Marinibactrum halimedae TaxID=1444977 RepID=A0AA37WLX1_9GAMM|nr:hypothetical protein [Marinibactrum halimedae]MCD9457414.1 hypothetical protein [Marinibactrum halimedae]GLS25535.1 hypothetical protein GCM10007877_12490 [Marinibactrum halimedae]